MLKTIPNVFYPQNGGLESSVNITPSSDDIQDKIDLVRENLSHAEKSLLTNSKEIQRLSRLVKENGKKILEALKDNDESKILADTNLLAGLEVIVKFDGSRPTYLIVDNQVDLHSVSSGLYWNDSITISSEMLKRVIPNVGRINIEKDGLPFAGTGFLIHQNLLVTNRHVLQEIGWRDRDKNQWVIDDTAEVDFSHDQSRITSSLRKIKKVLFAGNNSVSNRLINHSINDIAVLELESHDFEVEHPFLLFNKESIETKDIYIMGYPALPNLNDYELTLLEQLFQGEFGRKRLAPGLIMDNCEALPPWSFTHDATTLGGNSGSVVIYVNHENIAAGLHYGGNLNEPRRNYAHYISMLEDTDGFTNKTLRESLSEFNLYH